MVYKFLDSGNGQKLEQFGAVRLIRPCAQAIWKPILDEDEWSKAHARFSRENKQGWHEFLPTPLSWEMTLHGILLKLKRTDFGHLGIFPEHADFWPWIRKKVTPRRGAKILNLFAYSGGATLIAAQAGAFVCHLDASKGMIGWAQENRDLNQLQDAPIRYLVDDVMKFLKRAIRRNEKYDGIILDPPSFGRGKQDEIFKIERALPMLLDNCRELLSPDPLFMLLTCHTPSYTPLVLKRLLEERLEGSIEAGEMSLKGPMELPSGFFARWEP